MSTFGTPPEDPQQPEAAPAEAPTPEHEPSVGGGTLSPDGRFIWDGYRWMPNPVLPPPPSGYPGGQPGYPAPVAGPAPGLAYAGFGIRFLAYLVDSLILFVVFFVLAAVTGGFVRTSPDTGETTLNGTAYGLAFVAGIAYMVGFWGARGQTPGMMALNLHIVRAQDGTPIDFGVAVIRYVGYVVSSIPFGLGLLWAAFDPRKQGWHDKIAGTLVIRPVAP